MSLQAFRDTRAEAKRNAILEAAERLFSERGLTAVSMAQLAAEASVSTATLYRHFEDKEDVFGQVIDRLIDEFGVVSAPSSAQSALTEQLGTERIEALALRYARLLNDPKVVGLLRALVAHAENAEGFQQRLADHGNGPLAEEFQQEIRALFEQQALPLTELMLASAELRGVIEHHTIIPGLLFNDRLDNLEEVIPRCVASWSKRWLVRA